MGSNHLSITWVLLVFLALLPENFVIHVHGIKPTRLLDLAIRYYTFKSYKNFKTGTSYNVHLPSNLTGVNVSTVKYRCGSLKRYGANIQEFHLGVGVDVHPYVERVLIVTQNLGSNWSNIYYDIYDQLLGYQLVSPVLGLLAYNADDDTKYNVQFEVKIQSPNINGIKIDFSNYTMKKNNTLHDKIQMCATFGDDGNVTLEKEFAPNICATTIQGHFGLVVQSPIMLPERKKIKKWKVVFGSAFGGAIGAFLLGLLLIAMFVNVKKKARLEEMERRAYEEEALQVSMAGHVIRVHNVQNHHHPR
ncbi:transmembrane protein [Tanacetum coccineum]|uniref:Transmembrane protein n=1 Tax=Tanacetum coccineum TaxID=301880 RepID=A0ABQ5E6F0_9ASTR